MTAHWISVREAADFLGVCEKTVRRMVVAGSLPGYKVGPRTIRLRSDDVQNALVLIQPDGEQS